MPDVHNPKHAALPGMFSMNRMKNALIWVYLACAGAVSACVPISSESLAPPVPAASTATSAAQSTPPAEPAPAKTASSKPLPASTAEAEGIDPAALQKLLERARTTESDALVVMRNGKQIGAWYFEKPEVPIEAMSVTKSIVSLLVGALITDGKLKSIDQPVHEFYPEWKQGKKSQITLRHLLNHTSGIQSNPTTQEIYQSPDFLKLALSAELSSEPGTKFVYNNKAMAILAGVIRIASGKRMDEYARERLFEPLGIANVDWSLDKAGNPHAMAGLQILPTDLAKLGQIVLSRGKWEGRQVIAESYIEEATKQAQPFVPCGLLWWLLTDNTKRKLTSENLAGWKKVGVTPDVISKARALLDKEIEEKSYFEQLKKLVGEEGMKMLQQKEISAGKRVSFDVVGYNANGYLGQWIVVLPQEQIVVVRMRRYPGDEAKRDEMGLGFEDIVQLSRALPKKH